MSTKTTSWPPDGTVVRAKRLGWDEELTPEQFADMEPYEDKGYESDDLRGPIFTRLGDSGTTVLVGGQEADPKTVEVAEG